MKYKLLFLILMIICSVVLLNAVNYPKPTDYVNDYARVLDSNTRNNLSRLLNELDQKTGVQVAVVVVNDLQGLDRDLYASELYKNWGIGNKNDEGLLILLAVKDRQFKVEVGYGSEGYLTDGRTGLIIDQYIMPHLRSNDFSGAIIQAVSRFSLHIANEKKVVLSGKVVQQSENQEIEVSPLQGLIMLGIFIFLMIVTRGRILIWLLIFSGRGPRGRGGFGGGFGGFGGFGGGSSGGGGAGRSF